MTAKTSTIRLQLDLEIQRQTKTAYESYFSKLNISLNIEINTIETRVDFNSQGKRFSASDFLKSHSGVDFDSSIDIPEYFNVENTGQRMLDILTAGTEGDEFTDDWIEAKKSLVNKAYSEVTKMFGTLPQIVLDTQDYVLGKLDEMGD